MERSAYIRVYISHGRLAPATRVTGFARSGKKKKRKKNWQLRSTRNARIYYFFFFSDPQIRQRVSTPLPAYTSICVKLQQLADIFFFFSVGKDAA